MQKKIIVSFMLFCLISLMIIAGAEAKNQEENWDIKQQTIEFMAPDFTLSDLDGNTVSLNSLRGKVVLVLFTTTWCPYCIKDIPNLKKTYEQYCDKDFELLAVYIQESQRKVSSFAAKYNLPYTVLLDTKGAVARSYGVVGVPTKVLIGKDGKVYCRACRTLDIMLKELIGP
ncbi:MAG: TlpA family protein disulfide reductase [Deltaproteobacteria bacterium]|nr:TlpA family protein disulfide reductase [Deltaproteobacteria bacterium]